MTEITRAHRPRARCPLRVHTREIEGGGGQAEKSRQPLDGNRSRSLPSITVINFSKNGRQKILS